MIFKPLNNFCILELLENTDQNAKTDSGLTVINVTQYNKCKVIAVPHNLDKESPLKEGAIVLIGHSPRYNYLPNEQSKVLIKVEDIISVIEEE